MKKQPKIFMHTQHEYFAKLIIFNEDRAIYDAWEIDQYGKKQMLQYNGCVKPENFKRDWAEYVSTNSA
jgi:hypothetical protein